MSVTAASPRRHAGGAVPPERPSRLRQLVHLYSSPGDRTPMGVGVAIMLLASAGLVVLGPGNQFWLLACTGLLVYAVLGVVRPREAWRVLRGPAGPARRRGAPPPEAGAAEPEEGTDPSGWLPTHRSRRW